MIKKWSQKTHKDKWKEDPEEYKQTKMFLPDTDNSIWKKIENQSIKRIRLTTQIITGHATVRKHLTASQNVYSVQFTTHLYIIDRHFKHIEPRLMILIFLDQKLNADSKNISFKIFFC